MFNFEQRLSEISGQTVLCVGDVMLDEFVYGDVARVSPEAPAPVIAVSRQVDAVGGAGNVARNIASLGAHCIFVAVVGEDEPGRRLMAALLAEPRIAATLVVEPSRPTTRKMRFVSEHYSTHLLRADWELARPIGSESEAAAIEHALDALPRVGAVVLSDYAKGVLTPVVIATVIDAARRLNKPVIVDPKRIDFTVYAGSTLITPNRKELAEATRLPVATEAEVAAAAAEFQRLVGSEAVLVTRGEEGMTLAERGAAPVHIPAYPVRVRDVSGAGDTVAAVAATLLSMGASFELAARTANAAASVVVGKGGTATVSVAELRHRVLPTALLAPEDKIALDPAVLDERVQEWRRQGLRIGFTNGCFDLLHPGHVKVLAQARGACDRLIVGLNSDASARRLKGDGRPVQDQTARAEVLAALEAVDLVAIFEEDTPLELIQRVRPAVLIKGADYRLDEVVGRDTVEADGGEVVLVDIVPGHSSSNLVARARTS